MNPVTDGLAGNGGHKLGRRSLATLLGTAVIAVAALGPITAPRVGQTKEPLPRRASGPVD